ncbi:MAG TPA: PIN domain-containing protein [Thermomicrobiales bacterium]|nr:PIN domain-containing protein [Thermomicrobiales bacterium]
MNEADVPLAVLDSSVLVPYWSRAALRALALWRPPPYRPVWSTAIVAETWRILGLRAGRAGTPAAVVSRAAHDLWRVLDPLFLVADGSHPPAGMPPSPLRDPDDAHLWYAALNGGARYVVSHNTRDFPPLAHTVERIAEREVAVARHVEAEVEFLTAIEFIEDVLGADAVALCGRPLPPGAVVRSGRSRPAR